MAIHIQSPVRAVLKAFDIRQGEAKRAVLLQLNIFLIISTLLIVKPTANGLFLVRFGVENLPFAFIMVACVAAVVSTLYARLLKRASLLRIMNRTTLFSAVILVLIGAMLRLNLFESIVLYLFYIWVAIFALLATSQFWVLASLVLNTREAKRLFGFIGAGAIAGGVFGGYLTTLLAQRISSEYLLFICAVLVMLCIPINRAVWPGISPATLVRQGSRRRPWDLGEHPIALIRKSRHLALLAGIVGVSVVVAKLVDYQFAGVASALITDGDELTAFFGFWFSTFNLISLLLQLFLTRRVVGTFGVGSSLFFLPALVLGATIVLLIFPELLMAAIFLKMSDGSLKQSINKAAIELIILPIPMEVKNQAKTFIDVFVDSLATGISGLILIFFVRALDLSTRSISILILCFVGVWIYLAVRMRRQYIYSFRSRIAQTLDMPAASTKQFDLSSESAIGGFRKVLQSGTEQQMVYILRKIRELQDDRLFESVRALLSHSSATVRCEALRCLYYFRKRKVLEEVEPLTRDTDQDVKIRAFEYLFEHSPKDLPVLMRRYLRDPDYKVRSAALISLAVETQDNPTLRQMFHLQETIANRIEKLTSVQDPAEYRFRARGLLRAVGHARIPVFYPFIDTSLGHPDPDIRCEAIHAAGRTLLPAYVHKILPFLGESETRDAALGALKMYGPALIGILQEAGIPGAGKDDFVRYIPAVLKNIGVQSSVDYLFGVLEHGDMALREQALRALNTLRQSHPHLRFDEKYVVRRILGEAQLYQETLSVLYAQLSADGGVARTEETEAQIAARQSLADLLERRLDRNLERIFRLLGLKYAADDVTMIYRGIHSKKPEVRLSALEYLENLLEPGLKRILVPIVETNMLETISEEAIRNLNLSIPDQRTCFELLLAGRDMRVKFAVLYLLGQLRDPAYIPLVAAQTAEGQTKLGDFASGILEQLRSGV